VLDEAARARPQRASHACVTPSPKKGCGHRAAMSGISASFAMRSQGRFDELDHGPPL
jgi:hypothetical protein